MSVVKNEILPGGEIYQQYAPVVVIGSGPVGVRTVEAILKRDPQRKVIIYGDEPWAPYNRVRLSSLLAGEIRSDQITTDTTVLDSDNVIKRYHCPIVEIDRTNQIVIDANGNFQAYSDLVIATGSRPHIPGIPGIDKKGVFTLRNYSDAQQLQARKVRARRVVVIGGGLLGIEAARAMQTLNTEVVIVEHNRSLLNNILDEEAAEILRSYLAGLGLKIYLQDGVAEIVGAEQVTEVILRSGIKLNCDTVIVSTGIKPNITLALNAKLPVGRGIRVNDQMRTIDQHIYAVGECAEHRNKIYGIVAPGFEQAEVAAHALCGKSADYQGSIAVSRLKVVGKNIFSIGQVGEEEYQIAQRHVVYRNPELGVYRKLVLKNGRLVGAIATGDWQEQNRIQEAVTSQRYIWPWQLYSFRQHGRLWQEQEARQVNYWPASATVCNCMSVSRGQLSQQIEQGCQTLKEIKSATGASTVCGSCEPLIVSLLGSKEKPQPVIAAKALLAISVLILSAFVSWLVQGGIPYPKTVDVPWRWDQIWRDGFIKQVSGFTVLGLSLLALVLSLRKRVKKITLLDFAWWRLLHVVLGLLVLAGLLLHTGMRLGENLNLYLMVSFIGLLLVGSLASTIISLVHKVDAVRGQRVKNAMVWGHILLFWPVPALLVFHVLQSYYF